MSTWYWILFCFPCRLGLNNFCLFLFFHNANSSRMEFILFVLFYLHSFLAGSKVKVKVTSPWKFEFLPFSKPISSAIYNGSWQMTTNNTNNTKTGDGMKRLTSMVTCVNIRNRIGVSLHFTKIYDHWNYSLDVQYAMCVFRVCLQVSHCSSQQVVNWQSDATLTLLIGMLSCVVRTPLPRCHKCRWVTWAALLHCVVD